MKKRELLGMIKGLDGVVKLQTQHIRALEKQVSTLLERNPELAEQDKPKTLDQSVFDGQDDDYRYAVISIEGGVFLFSKKPKIVGGLWSWDVAKDKQKLAVKLGTYDASNWQNSLIEREAKPLSGNERIKKLLEKQKLVKIVVSDDSYDDARNNSNILVCDAISDCKNFPIKTQNIYWRYGIPIDDNGSEITEVD